VEWRLFFRTGEEVDVEEVADDEDEATEWELASWAEVYVRPPRRVPVADMVEES
jgi:hypothetical protein